MADRSKRNRRANTLDIEKAKREDLPRILEIYAGARQKMAETGNPTQWTDGYPAEELLKEDIARGELYKAVDQGALVGVFMLTAGPDDVYTKIRGAWLNDEPYLVIHRIAAREGRGVAKAVFAWVMKRTANLRIDTHEDNAAMRHILETSGFRYVGELTLPNGDARRAYHRTETPGQAENISKQKK